MAHVIKRHQALHFQWLVLQHNIHGCFCAITLQFDFARKSYWETNFLIRFDKLKNYQMVPGPVPNK